VQFSTLLSRAHLETVTQNISAVTLRIGEEASVDGASAMTMMLATFIPGPYRNTNIRFDFKDVTAWHAPDYETAKPVIAEAKVQTVSFSPEVDWCCAPPIEMRMAPSQPGDAGRDLTKIAIIVILVVVVLGAVHRPPRIPIFVLCLACICFESFASYSHPASSFPALYRRRERCF
jgi:hypothetical protein